MYFALQAKMIKRDEIRYQVQRRLCWTALETKLLDCSLELAAL